MLWALNATEEDEMSASRPWRAWSIVALLFLFMLINYADKAVIGLSAVPIMKELHLTNTQFGAIGSAFFLLFSASGVLVGFLANRVSSKLLIFFMALIWGLAQLPMAGAVGFTTLLIARIILGAGEGPAFPVTLHAIYKWFDDEHRTVPTSIIACGAAFGAGIIAPGITAIIVHFGWHAAFATLAVAGFVWACIWGVFGAEGRGSTANQVHSNVNVPYLSLITSRTALGVFVGGIAAFWAVTLNIVWLASYLVRAVHLTPTEAGYIIVLPSLMQILLAPSLGAWSEHLTRAGTSTRIARGVAGGLCLVIAGSTMVMFPNAINVILKIALIVVAFSVGSVFFTLGSPLIGEITPPQQRGALLGITNSLHALGGFFAPVIMGHIVDIGANPAVGFHNGFMIAGAFVIVCGVLAIALINPKADLVRWQVKGLVAGRDLQRVVADEAPGKSPV
jgi:MFS transporter, ACS family, D-galactonate transporter